MGKMNIVDPASLQNINEKLGLPRKYKFNLLVRLIMILFSGLVLAYSVWFIFFKLTTMNDATTLTKAIPFIILFAGLNTLLQNFFNIHSLTFTKEYLIPSSILGIKKKIPWDNITKVSMGKGKKKYIIISYLDDDNKQKQYNLMLVFKSMLEIIFSISELATNAKYDDFLSSILTIDKK